MPKIFLRSFGSYKELNLAYKNQKINDHKKKFIIHALKTIFSD